MNTAQNQTRAVSLSFHTQIHPRQTHILSHQKLSISFLGRRLGCHFLLPHCEQNQEVCERLRPRMQPESPLSLWKQGASCGPAPIQAISPSFTSPAPSTCGSLFKAPHQWLQRPQTATEYMKAGKRINTFAKFFFTPDGGQRKTTSLSRQSKKIWLCKQT